MIVKNRDGEREQPSVMTRVAENTAAYFEAHSPRMKNNAVPEDDIDEPECEGVFMDAADMLVDSFKYLVGDAQDVDDGSEGDVDEPKVAPAGVDGVVKTFDLEDFRCGSFQRVVKDAEDGDEEDDVDELENEEDAAACFAELASADEKMKAWKKKHAREEKASKSDDSNSDDPQKRLAALTERANEGDAEAIAGLRQMLDDRPEIWQKVGDLGTHAEVTLIQLIAQGDQLVIQSMRRHARQLRENLTTDPTNQLERLTVGRVVACWLHVQHADRLCANADAGDSPSTVWARRQEIAEKRYMTAIKSLKLVQKMMPRPTNDKPSSASKEAAEAEAADDKKPPLAPATENCRESSNGQHADHSQNGRHTGSPAQRPPPAKVVPKANGKSLNRMAAAMNGTAPPAPATDVCPAQ